MTAFLDLRRLSRSWPVWKAWARGEALKLRFKQSLPAFSGYPVRSGSGRLCEAKENMG